MENVNNLVCSDHFLFFPEHYNTCIFRRKLYTVDLFLLAAKTLQKMSEILPVCCRSQRVLKMVKLFWFSVGPKARKVWWTAWCQWQRKEAARPWEYRGLRSPGRKWPLQSSVPCSLGPSSLHESTLPAQILFFSPAWFNPSSRCLGASSHALKHL